MRKIESLMNTRNMPCSPLNRLGTHVVQHEIQRLLSAPLRLLCSSRPCLGLFYELAVHLLDFGDDERLNLQ